MVKPARAPVKPRIVSLETGDLLPLDDQIESVLARRQRGPIELLGERGAGKSTALAHLAAALAERDQVVLLDEPDVVEIRRHSQDRLVIFTSLKHCNLAEQSFYIAEWTHDDVIEYLLSTHPGRCRDVMQRLSHDDLVEKLPGAPSLWRVILDEMANSPHQLDLRQAIVAAVESQLPNQHLLPLAGQYCLALLIGRAAFAEKIVRTLTKKGMQLQTLRLLGYRPVRSILAARRIVAVLRNQRRNKFPEGQLPRDLVGELVRHADADPATMRAIEKLLDGKQSWQPMAASILHASRNDWKPAGNRYLARGYFEGARWADVDLAKAKLIGAMLNRASLSGANLERADLRHAYLQRASLLRANLTKANLANARLADADLSSTRAEDCELRAAELCYANVQFADMTAATLQHADLTGANFLGATLDAADLRGAVVEGTNFRRVNFQRAILDGVRLRLANLEEADFKSARLFNCDLEFVELPDARFEHADLTGAILTGSVMPRARFRTATLRSTGLADIEWEGADLRGADFAGCSFHMGSSRSGLVGSPYPGHGSRTGFYTDSFEEQHFKAPEEIRKANLCGADLRSAKVFETDFYLVDLRGAKYDADQAAYFRRCDAIVESRV